MYGPPPGITTISSARSINRMTLHEGEERKDSSSDAPAVYTFHYLRWLPIIICIGTSSSPSPWGS